jgi:spore maturation protein CgeB
MVENGEQMTSALSMLLNDSDMASDVARTGLATIKARHTCAHRVQELLGIVEGISGRPTMSSRTQVEQAVA